MSDAIIRVENLGKRYSLSHLRDQRYIALRDVLVEKATGLFKRQSAKSKANDASDSRSSISDLQSSRTSKGDFWALRNVSFEVRQGEVVGIIGRNGAGKSTLLKILSRITDPTEGRVRIKGRVASLLEVGTGFHPELTGRENIFLNGAILGMHRAEIKAKFDEIVAFAEVEKFLDTPVKRYSSGMYVRLAFAVAAHLEPEILVVDEVLAVGDAEFQKKCLGKMESVSKHEGRTILFVSHNMATIVNLCSTAMLLSSGRSSKMMAPQEAVNKYLASGVAGATPSLAAKPRFQSHPRDPIFSTLIIRGESGEGNTIPTGGSVTFEIELSTFEDFRACECGVIICDEVGQRVAAFHSEYHSGLKIEGARTASLVCHVPALPLVPGTYLVDLVLASGYQVIERVEQAGVFEVTFADVFGTGKIPSSTQGRLVLPCEWRVRN